MCFVGFCGLSMRRKCFPLPLVLLSQWPQAGELAGLGGEAEPSSQAPDSQRSTQRLSSYVRHQHSTRALQRSARCLHLQEGAPRKRAAAGSAAAQPDQTSERRANSLLPSPNSSGTHLLLPVAHRPQLVCLVEEPFGAPSSSRRPWAAAAAPGAGSLSGTADGTEAAGSGAGSSGSSAAGGPGEGEREGAGLEGKGGVEIGLVAVETSTGEVMYQQFRCVPVWGPPCCTLRCLLHAEAGPGCTCGQSVCVSAWGWPLLSW